MQQEGQDIWNFLDVRHHYRFIVAPNDLQILAQLGQQLLVTVNNMIEKMSYVEKTVKYQDKTRKIKMVNPGTPKR
eukprot:231628-Amphidinium_carterae.1